MAKKKQALGRGLGALLAETQEAYENNLSDNSELVVELSVDLIRPNPLQPRKNFNEESLAELSQSIKEHGILQPILVYEDDDEYFLIAGERRLRATKMANIDTIKAIVADIKPEKLRELALIENIQREDLNPIDLAISYESLIEDYGITQDELSNRIKKSRTQITNTLALLRLNKEVQQLLIDGKITQGHAKVLVNLSDDDCKIAIDSILGQKLSVRDTELLVKNLKDRISPRRVSAKNAAKFESEFDDELKELSKLLSRVDISSKISGDSITLRFKNVNNLKKLIRNLKNLGKD